MTRLSDLSVFDFSGVLRRRAGMRHDATILPARDREEYITFHYSGVSYPAGRDRDAQLAAILAEARYQTTHDYGAHSYPDGYLYDFVVLDDGLIVRTRGTRQRLWHAGNYTANRKSWSVHVLKGAGQNLTDAQRASLFSLFDALRAETGIPRQGVVAHCEWPRDDGLPVRSATYRTLPRQSACPGATLFPHIVAYRSLADALPVYRVTEPMPVYEVPEVNPARIALKGTAVLPVGQMIVIDKVYPNGIGHLVGGLGFVELVKAVKL